MAKTERDIKAELLGEVLKSKATGEYKPDRKMLLEPLDGSDTVIYSFCEGCGNYLEKTLLGVEVLAKQGGIALPESLKGLYFRTRSCGICNGEDKTVSLERI